jgi:hypothetical protein
VLDTQAYEKSKNAKDLQALFTIKLGDTKDEARRLRLMSEFQKISLQEILDLR